LSTLKEVADQAGVSIATVSLVLNGKTTVSEATRQKVLACIDSLNYRPNMVARGFKTKKTMAIAVLLPTITNPIYASFIHTVEYLAHENNYQVILFSYDHESILSNFDYLTDLYDRMVDGIIICGIPPLPAPNHVKKAKQIMQAFRERKTPFIFYNEEEQYSVFLDTFGIPRNDSNFMLLKINREQAVYEAVKHLIHIGHTRIGFIGEGIVNTYPQNIPYHKKLAGYKKALLEAGIPFNSELLITGTDGYQGGADCFNHLSSLENPPTAYVGTGDTISLGILSAATKAGFSIPDQIAVIGFDNIQEASFWNPKLSTISVPIYDIAKSAFNNLLLLMGGGSVPFTIKSFDTQLIIRESTH